MAILGRLVRLTLLAFVGVTAVSAVLALQRKRDAPPPPDPDADEIELVAIGQEQESRTLAEAVRLFAEHRVFVEGNRTVIFR